MVTLGKNKQEFKLKKEISKSKNRFDKFPNKVDKSPPKIVEQTLTVAVINEDFGYFKRDYSELMFKQLSTDGNKRGDQLTKLIGGYSEIARIEAKDGLTFFVNESGEIDQNMLNEPIFAMFSKWVHGPCVCIRTNDNGITTTLTEDDCDYLRKMLKNEGEKEGEIVDEPFVWSKYE